MFPLMNNMNNANINNSNVNNPNASYWDFLINGIIITYVITNINVLASLIKNIIASVYSVLVVKFYSYCKNKLIGSVVLRMEINAQDPLYTFISENVLIVNSDPSINKKSWILNIFTFLRDMNVNDKEEFKKKWKSKSSIINLETSYNSDVFSTKLVKKYNDNEIIRRIYHYNDVSFILKNIKKKEVNESFMTIKIISYKKKQEDNNIYINKFKSWLNGRFNCDEKLELVYQIPIYSPEISNFLYRINNFSFENFDSNLKKKGIGEIMHLNSQPNWSVSDFAKKVNLTTDINRNEYSEKYKNSKHKCIIDNCIIILDKDRPCSSNSENAKTRIINLQCGIIEAYKIIIISKNILEYDNIVSLLNKYFELLYAGFKEKPNEKYTPYIYTRSSQGWARSYLDIRSIDTIYLPKKQLDDIKKEFDMFIKTERLYKQFQIPYRKGILFHGPPGTGKTSLIKALASEYGLNIYIININDADINDDNIVSVLNSMQNNSNCILLFEDIDSSFADKESIKIENRDIENIASIDQNYINTKNNDNDNKNKNNDNKNTIQKPKFLTYSGLLNALDGILSNQNGMITIMTTNYIEKLGCAFLRPGRIDKIFYLGLCNDEQIANMLRSFINKLKMIDIKYFMDDDEINKLIDIFVKKLCCENGHSKIKPCELQAYILSNMDDIYNIFNNVDDLLKHYY